MSSELQSVITSIVENNYVTLVILTAVGYDYILTLSDEIEFIWCKPWTPVSTLFVLVRYCGLCGVMYVNNANSNTHRKLTREIDIPEPILLWGVPFYRVLQSCEIFGILGEWMLFLFLGAADLVMILRLWAMYSGSKVIISVLLPLYAMEILSLVVTSIIITIRLRMAIAQVLDHSFCMLVSASPISAEVRDSLQFALASVMFLLVAAKFIRHSVQMYNVTKRRVALSRYLKLFAREGLAYFFAILLFGLINVLFFSSHIIVTGWRALPIGISEYIPVFTLTPRFILSTRALYARDLRGRDLDTEFGLISTPVRSARESVIVFAEQIEREVSEQTEEIQMEGVGVWGRSA